MRTRFFSCCGDGALSCSWEQQCKNVNTIAEELLPQKSSAPRKPWISQETLALLDHKHAARRSGDWESERLIRKQVRQSARRDRARWLESVASTGSWASISKLRRGPRKNQGRLRNTDGDLVSSEMRAQAFAEHLETMQWYVRPVTLIPDSEPALNAKFNINCQPFTSDELRKAIRKMSQGKATKPDDIPVECYRALEQEGDKHFDWLLTFCNECWSSKEAPTEWCTASVALIYKKGDPASCDNYRPICLLTVAYKLFAWMLKNRMLQSGIDSALWASQFGFRENCSTEDAIFVARRRIELARAQRNGKVSMLALDWRKAFDSLRVESLIDALRRFGLPEVFPSHGVQLAFCPAVLRE